MEEKLSELDDNECTVYSDAIESLQENEDLDEYDLDILSCRADSSDLVLIYSFPSGIYRKESLLEVYVTLVFVLMAWDITS